MAVPMEERSTAVVFDKRLESHFSKWNKDFTERPQRVIEILQRCNELQLLERCKRIPVREATEAEILSCHSKAHLSLLESSSSMTEDELKRLSQKYDFIYFHERSAENAKLALGGIIDLVDAVVSEQVLNGMAIIRPPGHHAMKDEYCGYCYLGNVAVAAKLMLEKYKLKRILILDWDVHHGQGSQFMFYEDPRVMYVSVHRYENGREWPNLREGDYDYIGDGSGRGFNINVPLNETGCDNSDYLAIMFNLLMPIFYQFDPEVVLVSAGYDCAIGCPEGEMSVTPACFAHFVNLLKPLAQGKLALLLEGGYNLKSLAESAALSLRALLGDPTPAITPISQPRTSICESILNCIKVLHQPWPCLQYQDFVEAGLIKAETYPYKKVLHMPPVKDVEFLTAQNRPEVFPLIQACADESNMHKQAEFNRIISQLVQDTSLAVPTHRFTVFSENDNSLLCSHIKRCHLSSKHFYQQDANAVFTTAPCCIKASVDSVISNQVQSCLCCCRSSYEPQNVNGKPVNGTSHSELSLVNALVHHATESHHLHRILVIDLGTESSHQNIVEDSANVLYVAVRVAGADTEQPLVSQHTLDIPLPQESVCDADYISLFLQVVLPVAYEFCPQLVVLKVSNPDNPQKFASRACMGHLTQLVLGLAEGKLILLVEEEQGRSAGAPNKDLASASGAGSSGDTVIQSASVGEERPTLAMELLEECVAVVLGDRCKALQLGIPSQRMVSTIKCVQDQLKDFWSVLKFRVQLPSMSI